MGFAGAGAAAGCRRRGLRKHLTVAHVADWERLMDFYGDDDMLSCEHPATRRALRLPVHL